MSERLPLNDPDYGIVIAPATDKGREDVERIVGEPLASDACLCIAIGTQFVGWGDDYGTFHPAPGCDRLKDAAEEFIGRAADLLADWMTH